jgi:FkbM family methyltransferase
MSYYSQFEQDKFVYENYFQGKTNGYFVDIGAHDGTTFSNSRFFEELGWDGVCIEPNPKVFETLISTRKCKCVRKAVADYVGEAKFFQITKEADMLSGLVDEFNQHGVERIYNNLQDLESGFDYIDVETELFHNIVNNTTIDFLSLDTEGNELKILQTIDFDKYDIKIITVENNDVITTTSENLLESKFLPDRKFLNFLTSKGYSFVTRLGCDELYVKNK